jgi:hypothetical protein
VELGAAKKGGESGEVRKLRLVVQRLQDQLADAGLLTGGGAAAEDGDDGATAAAEKSGGNAKSPAKK